MSETLQRTEQVITVAELREILDDEDRKSFADLTSKGMAEVRGGAWRREQDGRWRFWQIQTGRMMIDTNAVMSALAQKRTSAHKLMSALDQKRTSAVLKTRPLPVRSFDTIRCPVLSLTEVACGGASSSHFLAVHLPRHCGARAAAGDARDWVSQRWNI